MIRTKRMSFLFFLLNLHLVECFTLSLSKELIAERDEEIIELKKKIHAKE